jgi:hypothetical protein
MRQIRARRVDRDQQGAQCQAPAHEAIDAVRDAGPKIEPRVGNNGCDAAARLAEDSMNP